MPKSLKLFQHAETIQAQSIQYTSPNQFELEAMCDTIQSHPILSLKPIKKHIHQLKSKYPYWAEKKRRGGGVRVINLTFWLDAPQLAYSVLPHAIYLSNYIPNVVTKLGEQGCLYVGQNNAGNSVVKYFSPEYIQPDEIKSVTGAGDW